MKAPIHRVQARVLHLHPLTTAFKQEERWMLRNVIADLERGGRHYELVIENNDLPKEVAVYVK